MLNNPRDDVALLRVINTPARGIGKKTIGRLSDYATRHGLSLLEAARHAARNESLGARTVAQVAKFVKLFDQLTLLAAAQLEEILGYVLAESGYKKQFERSDSEEDLQRLANIEELLTVAREFDERQPGGGRLEEFLEETSLVNDTDDWESENDRVTLMTLHAAKGLEFPVVYLVAVEEGLLPHERSRQRLEQLEEERRLMFVGITRAQQELQISMAGYRDFRGQRKVTIPSQFLMEIPRAELEVEEVDAASPSWFDSDYDQPVIPAATFRAAAATRTASPARLTTAAELANGGVLPIVAPDEFRQDMLVRHPEHGLGRIIALSGSGPNRKATVQFASAAGRKKFLITRSPLRPVKSPQ